MISFVTFNRDPGRDCSSFIRLRFCFPSWFHSASWWVNRTFFPDFVTLLTSKRTQNRLSGNVARFRPTLCLLDSNLSKTLAGATCDLPRSLYIPRSLSDGDKIVKNLWKNNNTIDNLLRRVRRQYFQRNYSRLSNIKELSQPLANQRT